MGEDHGAGAAASEMALMQERLNALSSQLQTALNSGTKKRHAAIPLNAVMVSEHHDGGSNKEYMGARRERLGLHASIATKKVLESLQRSNPDSNAIIPPPIARILDMFQHPARHVEYLNSETFAMDLYKVTMRVRTVLEQEPRVVFLQSPVYVFGDIHGNLEDLHFFSDNLWRLGMSLSAGNFLFLGDYVDRGLQCLECMAYLFALKLQNPLKVHLLRGNHETRDVNGWEEHYGHRSFLAQCKSRFGDEMGKLIWESVNQAFDRLPLSAVIDNDIFCVHGGIPRPIPSSSSSNNSNNNHNGYSPTNTTTRIQDILAVPKIAGVNPPYEHEDDLHQQVASDCIWSDPATEEQELTTVDPDTGFGESLRGGGVVCFGNKALTDFLQELDFSYIMRAHESHAEGVAVSKGARVFTVFSTSKDHHQGKKAMAGCILVDNTKLQVINRSPAYKNQHVHTRESISLRNVSEAEIQQRIQLGLIRDADSSSSEGGADDLDEAWEDFSNDDSDNDDGGDDDDAEKSDPEEEQQQEPPVVVAGNNNDAVPEGHQSIEKGGLRGSAGGGGGGNMRGSAGSSGGGGRSSMRGSARGSSPSRSSTSLRNSLRNSLMDTNLVLATTRRSSVVLSKMNIAKEVFEEPLSGAPIGTILESGDDDEEEEEEQSLDSAKPAKDSPPHLPIEEINKNIVHDEEEQSLDSAKPAKDSHHHDHPISEMKKNIVDDEEEQSLDSAKPTKNTMSPTSTTAVKGMLPEEGEPNVKRPSDQAPLRFAERLASDGTETSEISISLHGGGGDETEQTILTDKLQQGEVLTDTEALRLTIAALKHRAEIMQLQHSELRTKIESNQRLLAKKETKIRSLYSQIYQNHTMMMMLSEEDKEHLERVRVNISDGTFQLDASSFKHSFAMFLGGVSSRLVMNSLLASQQQQQLDSVLIEQIRQIKNGISEEEALRITNEKLRTRTEKLEEEHDKLLDQLDKTNRRLEERDATTQFLESVVANNNNNNIVPAVQSSSSSSQRSMQLSTPIKTSSERDLV